MISNLNTGELGVQLQVWNGRFLLPWFARPADMQSTPSIDTEAKASLTGQHDHGGVPLLGWHETTTYIRSMVSHNPSSSGGFKHSSHLFRLFDSFETLFKIMLFAPRRRHQQAGLHCAELLPPPLCPAHPIQAFWVIQPTKNIGY